MLEHQQKELFSLVSVKESNEKIFCSYCFNIVKFNKGRNFLRIALSETLNFIKILHTYTQTYILIHTYTLLKTIA